MKITEDTKVLTDAAVLEILSVAREKAAALNQPQCIVVVDASGVTLGQLRMRGARFFSLKSAAAKARTAASIGAESSTIPEAARILIASATGGAATGLAGGLPIWVAGALVGSRIWFRRPGCLCRTRRACCDTGRPTMRKIALLGTGLMGAPIARHLGARFDISVRNRNPNRTLPLADIAQVAGQRRLYAISRRSAQRPMALDRGTLRCLRARHERAPLEHIAADQFRRHADGHGLVFRRLDEGQRTDELVPGQRGGDVLRRVDPRFDSRWADHGRRAIPLMIHPVKRSVGRLCISVTIPSHRGRLPNHQFIPLQMLETRFPTPRTKNPRTDPRLGKKPPLEGLMIRKAPSKIPPLSARTERTAQTASPRLFMRNDPQNEGKLAN